MDIKLAAVIRFDFCETSKEEEIEDCLSELYQTEGDSYGGAVVGTGGSWRRTEFVGSQIPDSLPEFESVTSYIEPDRRHILDVTTVARLSESQIQEIEENDSSRTHAFIGDLMDSIDSISNSIPSAESHERDLRPTIFYVEPAERQQIGWTDKGLDLEAVQQYLRDNRTMLGKIHLLLGHPISLIGSEDFITPQSLGHRGFRRLTMFNRSSTFELGDESKIGPIWLRRAETALKDYFRADVWIRSRLTEIDEIDEHTHGTSGFVDKETNDLDDLLSAETELESLRRDWTNTYTRTLDEIDELRSDFPALTDDEYEHNSEIPVPSPEYPEREPQSILERYDQNVRLLLETTESDLERIGQKLDRVSQLVHDSITAQATSTNTELQQDVTELTRVLTWLTVILTLFGGVQLGLALVSAGVISL